MAIKGIPHDSSWGHVTGKSVFLDDRPPLHNELHVGVVGSPVAKGRVVSIDTHEAEAMSGVVAVYTAKDLHHNIWGTIIQDQPLLAHDRVSFVGEPMVVVAAETRDALRLAKKKVHIEIEAEAPVLTIAEARQREDFIAVERTIARGDIEQTLADAPHVLSGTFFNKGQDHFYLESHAAIVYPGENGELEVHASSQHPTETQHLVAEAIGLKQHQVICIVKRMGGGFGGKESQAAPFAAYAGLVAHKLQRPARLILSKDDDMMMTGKRHPFETDYRIGFDENGQILGAEILLFSDGGAFADLSTSVLERAMLHSDNAYYLPVANIKGRVCRTNTPPNTAFRGFGGPQGVAVIEHLMEDIAIYLKKDSYDIRQVNCYQGDRNVAPYGQVIDDNVLPEIFSRLKETSEYTKRRTEIDAFNSRSKTQIKGMAVTAVKFGIAFTTRFLNQGNALVNIHQDGTIQVSTGATEMGQGVNTKIRQIVADSFTIEPEHVIVMSTSTARNHNTSPTAASSGTDINGAAAVVACNELLARLKSCVAYHFDHPDRDPTEEIEISVAKSGEAPAHIGLKDGAFYHKERPEQTMAFAEAVNLTYFNRISLSGYGFYKTPGIGFNKDTGEGHPFLYYTNGAAVSEVLIDRFTGELKVLRSDILMDLGRPINEAIDYGQVSGAFVQGMGWVTTEDLVYTDQGILQSHSPTTYKIPNVQDTPRVFNIDLIQNQEHKNVRGSKAVGEPPLLLGLSVWAAAKNALSYRTESFEKGLPGLKIPASAEHVLMTLTRAEASGRETAAASS